MTFNTKLGISAPTDINAIELASGGSGFRFDVQRSYFSSMPSSLNSNDVKDDVAKGRQSVLSVKPGPWADASGIAQKLKSAAQQIPQEAYVKLFVQHEPEDNCTGLPNGGQSDHLGSISDWKRLQAACGRAIASVNTNRDRAIIWGVNFMSWSVGNGNADRLYTADANWKVAAFDGYSWNGQARRSPGEIFNDNRDWADKKGLGFAINETGIGSDLSNRAEWVQDLWTYCKRSDVNCRWACYWQSSEQFELTTDAQIDALAWRP